ncbi:YebC/PmpR family DNA-binding transcriptional regulator [Spirochaeta cellobiosiphila]|uniref:YebC/PmpR family DNA-binding transcriptional regulator n=1 Tax=Spirochaeta cellobiosiphila TaxID=504483 RepID=UPI0004252497|nr:YebC/PmpR family DNA-binding transcriptional regulator [Spirochaeta cellobiosiphila]
MSGHSKWANIKHRKGAQDAKRGRIFAKIIKEITVAARLGGGELDSNPKLRTAVLKARGQNMPTDNIDRAIKKGTGDLDGVDYVELQYEGYAIGGVAIMVDTLTDNKNRTAADVRSIFTKAGGSLGTTGSVSYLFSRKGLIAFDASKYSEDEIFEAALESGAEDVSNEGEVIEVSTSPEMFDTILEELSKKGYENEMAEISMVPSTTVALDKEKTQKVLNLIEKLEDNDDVQSVSSNLEVPDDWEDNA